MQFLSPCIAQKYFVKFRHLFIPRPLADSIQESYYGCNLPECSKDAFIEYCFGQGNGDVMWNTMSEILRYGFHETNADHKNASLMYESKTFQAPSFYKTINYEEWIIILGENVNIRERPSLNAKFL